MTSKTPTEWERHQSRLIRPVLLLFLATLLVLAMFQSSALLTLAYDLDPSPLNEQVTMIAEGWHGWMQTIGTASVTEQIGEAVTEMHNLAITQ